MSLSHPISNGPMEAYAKHYLALSRVQHDLFVYSTRLVTGSC